MKVRRVDYYPDEYVVGVSSLTFEQQGLYWMVCSLIMSHGGPIPNDPKWIGKLGGTGAARCRRLLSELFDIGKLVEKDGKIGQKRAENELELAQKRIETAAKNGRNGGRPSRENNDLAKPGGFSGEKLTTNYQLPTYESDTESEPDSHPPEPDTHMADPPVGDPADLFPIGTAAVEAHSKPTKADLTRCFNERFWPSYPRKVGKPQALAKFIVKARQSTARAIVAGLRAHVVAWEESGIESKFIPHPSTWLNQERYLEPPDVPRSQAVTPARLHYGVAQYA